MASRWRALATAGWLVYLLGGIGWLIWQAENGWGLYGLVADLQLRASGHFDGNLSFIASVAVVFAPAWIYIWYAKRQAARARPAGPAGKAPLSPPGPADRRRVFRTVGFSVAAAGLAAIGAAVALYVAAAGSSTEWSSRPITTTTLRQLEAAGGPVQTASPWVRIREARVLPRGGWAYVSTQLPSGGRTLHRYLPLQSTADGAGSAPSPPAALTFVVETTDLGNDPDAEHRPATRRDDGIWEGRIVRKALPVFVRGAFERRGLHVADDTVLLYSTRFLNGQPPPAESGLGSPLVFVLGLFGAVLVAMGLLMTTELLQTGRRKAASK